MHLQVVYMNFPQISTQRVVGLLFCSTLQFIFPSRLNVKYAEKALKKIVSKWLLACVVNESGGGGSGARSLAKNTKQKKLCVARALATRTYASLIFATIKKKCKFVSVFWQIVYIFEFIFAHRNKYICVVFRKKYKICI